MSADTPSGRVDPYSDAGLILIFRLSPIDLCSPPVPPKVMVRHSLDSVNDFARQGYNLRITCDGCGRVIEANAIEMMVELNRRRAPLGIAQFEERAKCRECGHRGAAVTACEVSF